MRGQAAPAKTVYCKTCGRGVEIPAEGDEQTGHPYGWFYLSVNVPAWFNSDSRRAYRPVGMYCSANCLAAGMPEVERQEALMDGAYDRE